MRSIVFAAIAAIVFPFVATAATGTPVPPPANPHQGWWYQDKDADGYCLESSAVNAVARPSGMKSFAECAGMEPDDTNKFVSPVAPTVPTPTSADKAAWTIGLMPAQADPASPVFVKARDQIEACEGLGHTWIVYRGVCNCTEKESAADSQFGVGFVWRIYRNDQTHKWEGTCDAIHGGAGSGGYDARARKAAADNAAALQTHTEADTEAHTGFTARDAELQRAIEANGDADGAAWLQYRTERDAAVAAHKSEEDQFRAELVRIEREQDAEIGEAKSAADGAKAEAKAVSDKLDTHTSSHLGGTVGAALIAGVQTPVVDADGQELRSGSFIAPAVSTSLHGHPFDNGLNAGVEVVGGWVPSERGVRFLAGPTVGYDWDRLGIGATVGGYYASTGVVGREGEVEGYGIHGGAYASYLLTNGLALTGGFKVGTGVRSVLSATGQDIDGAGMTFVQGGLVFAY
ncbi:MAG: hypothetical protein WC702_01700 [Patescibacteria group bacterium]|jgi:hypothetical protein